MATFKVAHIKEQGQDMVVIFVSSSVGSMSSASQIGLRDSLQACAGKAGLKGHVVLVWDNGGRMGFLAPKAWSSFFSSVSLPSLYANVNRELSCA